MKTERGFTLLEVMVALAVFAALAAAILSASQLVLRQGLKLEERVLGAWVLDNRLQELRLQPDGLNQPAGRSVPMGGRQWLLEQRVSLVPSRALWHVELEVRSDSHGASPQLLEAWMVPTR
jgi:general secretion pathway protein I